MSCHSSSPAPDHERSATATLPDRLRVLLVGGPNVGQSTLCNALTAPVHPGKATLWQESRVGSVEHVILPGSDLDVLVPLSINHILQGVGFFYQSWAPIEDVPAGEQ